jgi:hypothetical protein
MQVCFLRETTGDLLRYFSAWSKKKSHCFDFVLGICLPECQLLLDLIHYLEVLEELKIDQFTVFSAVMKGRTVNISNSIQRQI